MSLVAKNGEWVTVLRGTWGVGLESMQQCPDTVIDELMKPGTMDLPLMSS